MTLAPLRTCPTPRCPALTRGGKCDTCKAKAQQEGDARRGTAQQRGYDAQWAAFSTRWRTTYPICGMRADRQLYPEHSQCVQQGRYNGTDLVVDHIVPLSQGGAKYDDANLQTLCRRCNSAKDGWTHNSCQRGARGEGG